MGKQFFWVSGWDTVQQVHVHSVEFTLVGGGV